MSYSPRYNVGKNMSYFCVSGKKKLAVSDFKCFYYLVWEYSAWIHYQFGSLDCLRIWMTHIYEAAKPVFPSLYLRKIGQVTHLFCLQLNLNLRDFATWICFRLCWFVSLVIWSLPPVYFYCCRIMNINSNSADFTSTVFSFSKAGWNITAKFFLPQIIKILYFFLFLC